MLNDPSVAVVIPTYNRGEILLATIELLLTQEDLPDEILIIDQTVYGDSDHVLIRLQQLVDSNHIIWARLAKPSIPAAMNKGLALAKSDFVLFLDDDISFKNTFIGNHRKGIELNRGYAHVGQILQPRELSEARLEGYQAGSGLIRDLAFPFRSNSPSVIYNCMAGNLLVNRESAIKCGGFDEQFSGAAYRFETEFCRRMIASTGKPFHFYPDASLDHLKEPTGGTRDDISSFLTSWSPSHSQGDYYFALTQGQNIREKGHYIFSRLFGSVRARFYLGKPWWIPVRLLGEFRGLVSAICKIKEGSKLLS